MITDHHVFVIAEAGVNHNGSLVMAKQLVDAAADAGADAVKFQTFCAESLVRGNAPKADYQLHNTDAGETQLAMLGRLELSERDHIALIAHARNRDITFLSTPFDVDSLGMLVERFALDTIKVSSGEITNAPFLLEIARTRRRVILSTGMSTLAEVRFALGVLAFGFAAPASAQPATDSFIHAFGSSAGQAALRQHVTLLHCTTEYPAPCGEVNLRAMDTLAAAFGLPVGYSDHTAGIHVAVAAVARGAIMIEKHCTLDRKLPGPDHKASLEPDELAQMVRQIRDIEQALGDGVKQPAPGELKNRDVARRSLVAACNISAGELFSAQNLTCKRPGDGAPPVAYWRMLGKAAPRAYSKDEKIDAG
jgi:N-acetylneuraminate synthase